MNTPPTPMAVQLMTEFGTEVAKEPSNSTDPLSSDDRAKLAATKKAVLAVTGSTTESRIPISAQLVRLASKLGVTPTDLAARMSPDTVRRTRYPVIERDAGDGKTIYEHPLV